MTQNEATREEFNKNYGPQLFAEGELRENMFALYKQGYQAALSTFPRVSEAELASFFIPLIEHQAQGEWDDIMIRTDAEYFARALFAKFPFLKKE